MNPDGLLAAHNTALRIGEVAVMSLEDRSKSVTSVNVKPLLPVRRQTRPAYLLGALGPPLCRAFWRHGQLGKIPSLGSGDPCLRVRPSLPTYSYRRS